MCGIFGWVPPQAYPVEDVTPVARKMLNALHLRGPDSSGYTIFNTVGKKIATETGTSSDTEGGTSLLLGHTRLSVIDLSTAGHQPMCSNDGRYTIAYNGEIYNYLELREELVAQGCIFNTQSDTEVVLQAFIQWGHSCLVKFVGMFAIVIYDSHTEKLFCARDFFGIKPLYWMNSPSAGIALSSELPALFCIPGISKKLNWQHAYDYLVGGRVDAGSNTLLENFYHLPPAHWMIIDVPHKCVQSIERYWHVPLPEPSSISFSDAADKLRHLFLESVKMHLRSDVPLGVALSGGLDSSAVACAVRYLNPDAPLHTFTYSAADSPDISEEKWADLVIKHTQAISHKVTVSANELVRDLDILISRLGEPFGSTSIYAQHRIFKLVHENNVVVTLDGQGADELLAGYWGYPQYRIRTLLSKMQYYDALRFLINVGKWPGRSSLQTIKQVIRPYVPEQLLSLAHRCAGKPLNPSWLNINALRDHNVKLSLPDSEGIYKSKDKVREILAQQLTWRGLPNLLRHGDRNAMSYSVESRVPFCTREIAEFCLSLPEEYLIAQDGTTKAVFRKAMQGIVPSAILARRDKVGFATPEKKWMKELSPWVETQLKTAEQSLIFNKTSALKEWGNVVSGKKEFDWRIWRWVNYLRWKQIFEIQE